MLHEDGLIKKMTDRLSLGGATEMQRFVDRHRESFGVGFAAPSVDLVPPTVLRA